MVFNKRYEYRGIFTGKYFPHDSEERYVNVGFFGMKDFQEDLPKKTERDHVKTKVFLKARPYSCILCFRVVSHKNDTNLIF